jgi:hypothetical protein
MDPWQTRSADYHPYMVDALEALPPNLRAAAEAALPPGAWLLRGFVVPADYRSPDGIAPSRVVPAQALLFASNGVLRVQAPTLGAAEVAPPVFLQPANLLWMRSSHLLLYGKLELVCGMQGEVAAVEMEFNAVGWRLMQVEWHELVAQAIGVTLPAGQKTRDMLVSAPQGEEAEEEAYTLDEQAMLLLAAAPDKFVDGIGRYGLYTGEKLLGVMFQPTVWKENLLAFDEQLLPNTLVALTEASVLILAEEPALVRKSEQFGLIITRIPRAAITAVTTAAEEPLQKIQFSLERAGVTAEQSVLLVPEIAQSWLELWDKQ